MAKVTGSYESVVRGVSEQVPQDRRSGQHYEQVNMLSDPVRGLARRHGSHLLDEVSLGSISYASLLADTCYHKAKTFSVDGIDYDIIYATTATASGQAGFAWAFNRLAGVFLPIVYAEDDDTLDLLVSGGVSAAVNVGRYLYLAGREIIPTYTGTDSYGDAANKSKVAVWIRGGAFSRTFKVTITKNDGSKVVAEYKTLSSSYPELLDTSDLLTSDADYQKKVNDRVNAYNSEVTKWIGTSAADITPENIATKLKDDLIANGITGVTVQAGTVLIDNADIKEAEGEDGGDGSLMHVVGNEVSSPELVSTIHYAGKIVKVRPQRSKGDDTLYLEAYAKDDGSTGWTEVAWRETAGYRMQPTAAFCMATVHSGSLYIAGSAAKLQALVGFEVPNYKANAVGDQLTSALPYLFGKRIDYLGLFQDRLVIGSGATILFSRPGDYLNWFRQSVLTVPDNDPWEGYALGAEDDVIRYSVTYDRNLLLYGNKFQYIVSGRQQLTPTSANIVPTSKYEDATDACPQASGNFVFYGKYAGEEGARKASLHQVQAGVVADSPESYDASMALDGYIAGKPVEIVAMTKPNTVIVRTDITRNGFYTYGYLDNANASERLIDAWSRWEWNDAMGGIIGVTAHSGAILTYMLRHNGETAYVACERFVRDSGLSEYPYADSLRPLAEAEAAPGLDITNSALIVAQQRKLTANPFMGQPISGLSLFKTMYPGEATRSWVGYTFDAYVTPTNPYLRDQNNKVILDGRLTLGRVVISFADTGGLKVEVNTSSGMKVPLDFNGRILGHSSNVAGQQPILTTQLSAVVGREVRECTYTLRARTWLPLTITAIEWTGQSFNNSRRV